MHVQACTRCGRTCISHVAYERALSASHDADSSAHPSESDGGEPAAPRRDAEPEPHAAGGPRTTIMCTDCGKGRWSDTEDDKLQQLFTLHGNKWPVIAGFMDGRTSGEVQRRWSQIKTPSKRKAPADVEQAAASAKRAGAT